VPTEVIPDALDGERIDRVVSMVTGLSRSESAELVVAGRVTVNGVSSVQRSARLRRGDVVEIDTTSVPAEEARIEPDPDVTVVVVHEDDDLLVVDKAPGVVVHPGSGNRTGTLVHGLLARYPELRDVGVDPTRPGIVHRLDKETSGLLVVARRQPAYEALVEMLAARRVERRYLALTWGSFDAPRGVVDAPIGRSSREPTRMVVSARGKQARTGYEVVTTFHDPVEVSLLECRLETGRTHQIRVHLAAIDHPVVGDDRYGGVRQSLDVPRLFLHAAALAFDHPITKERVEIESPLPNDLRSVLDRLG
jgi:23S rRNA pseudouridine1911/1915/1917 synthase